MNRWCRRLLFLAGSAVMAVTACEALQTEE